MAISFRQLTVPPLHEFTASAPSGAVIGLVGESGSGTSALLRAAGGKEPVAAGTIEGDPGRRYLAPGGSLVLAPADVMLVDHTFDGCDALVRARAAVQVERLRRGGATVLIASHDESILRQLCDEVWWLEGGVLAAKGDPAEVME
jgi:ABC-type polysaccharide/polyol phosphate transport system ATPase subunit